MDIAGERLLDESRPTRPKGLGRRHFTGRWLSAAPGPCGPVAVHAPQRRRHERRGTPCFPVPAERLPASMGRCFAESTPRVNSTWPRCTSVPLAGASAPGLRRGENGVTTYSGLVEPSSTGEGCNRWPVNSLGASRHGRRARGVAVEASVGFPARIATTPAMRAVRWNVAVLMTLSLALQACGFPIDDTALAADQLGDRIRSTNTDQCGCRSGSPQWLCVRGDGEPGYPEARGGAPCGSGAAGGCTRSTGDHPCVHPLRGRCGRGVCGPVRGCRRNRTASLSMQASAQL
jgi:hypothetical protein